MWRSLKSPKWNNRSGENVTLSLYVKESVFKYFVQNQLKEWGKIGHNLGVKSFQNKFHPLKSIQIVYSGYWLQNVFLNSYFWSFWLENPSGHWFLLLNPSTLVLGTSKCYFWIATFRWLCLQNPSGNYFLLLSGTIYVLRVSKCHFWIVTLTWFWNNFEVTTHIQKLFLSQSIYRQFWSEVMKSVFYMT